MLRLFDVDLTFFMEKLVEYHNPKERVTTKELRDIWFGTIFRILALVRSGRLGKLSKKEIGAFAKLHLGKLVSLLLDLSERKSFLAELSYSTLESVLAQFSKEDCFAYAVPLLNEKLSQPPSKWDANMLCLALYLYDKFDVFL